MSIGKKMAICVMLLALTTGVLANEILPREIQLEQINTLAVNEPLIYDNGEPVAVIDTGVIADSSGNPARGPHTFEFTLSADAPFAVMIRGERVEPGGTLNFVSNLTEVSSRLIVPIYPAELGLGGSAQFVINMPELYIRACPIGYTEAETDCYRLTYDELIYICPTSETEYREDTSDCRGVRVTPSIPYCDAPFVIDNGVCVHQFTIDATENCPTGNGWTNNNGTCEYFEQQPIQSCPTGYTLKGNLCYEVMLKSQECPTGYVNNGTSCVKDEQTNATPNCPSGYSLNGTQCSKVETQAATTSCPSGYTKSGTQCNKTETTTATGSCPSGYTLSGSNCTKTETIAATGTCPSGYSNYSSTKCKKTSTYSSTQTCPSSSPYTNTISYYASFVNEEQGTCSARVSVTPNKVYCPSGYNSYRDTSVSYERYKCATSSNAPDSKKPTSVSCPSGSSPYTYESTFFYTTGFGYCSKTNTFPSNKTCPDGGTLSGTDCVKTTYVDKTFTCPSGYSLSGTSCTRTLSQSATYSCPSGYSLSGTSCSRTLSQSVTYSCPSGYSLSGTTCSRTLTSSPTYTCTSGWTLSGTSCERTLTESINFYCDTGTTELDADNCYNNDASGNVGNCPSGFTLNSTTGSCEASDSQEVVYSCPTENGEKYTLQADKCDYYDWQAAYTKCEEGATLDADGATCSRQLIETAIPSCELPDYIPLVEQNRCMLEERVPFGQ